VACACRRGWAAVRPCRAKSCSRSGRISTRWSHHACTRRFRPRRATTSPSSRQRQTRQAHRKSTAKRRGAALATKPIAFQLDDSGLTYTLDPTAERPRVAQATGAGAAPLVVTGPDEELIRLVSGRHFVPGTRPRLEVARGTPQELAALRRAFRSFRGPVRSPGWLR
jgi:hypothetical protein